MAHAPCLGLRAYSPISSLVVGSAPAQRRRSSAQPTRSTDRRPPGQLAVTLRARVDEGLNDAAFLEYVCGRLNCSQHAALLRLPPPQLWAAAPAPAGEL